MKIYIDGSGWNGKESKLCIAKEDGAVVRKVFKEKRTNNEMEYEALLLALQLAEKGDRIYTDSQLILGHLCYGWRIKARHLFPLIMRAKKLKEEKKVRIYWIPRKKNVAGHLI